MEEPKIVTNCNGQIEKYIRLMYRTANAHLAGRKEEVEEAIARVCLAFLKRCRDGRIEDRGVGALLQLQVEQQCAKVAMRAAKLKEREGTLEVRDADGEAIGMEELIPDSNPMVNPEKFTLYQELLQELRKCLAHLPPAQREVVLLDAEEWTNKEIAAKMNTPVGTVGFRLTSARRSLRLCLTARGYKV